MRVDKTVGKRYGMEGTVEHVDVVVVEIGRVQKVAARRVLTSENGRSNIAP
jgi:hypothetical protein